MSWSYLRRFQERSHPAFWDAHAPAPKLRLVPRTPHCEACWRRIWDSLYQPRFLPSQEDRTISGRSLVQACLAGTVVPKNLRTLEVQKNDRYYREKCAGAGTRKSRFDKSI